MKLALLPLALAALAAPTPALADVTATLTPTTTFPGSNRQVGAGPGPTRTYTVTSTGSDPLTIRSISFTGPDAGQFALTGGTCAAGTVLAPAQACTVIAAFSPTLTGARSTTLAVATSGPSLTSAALTGTGRDLEVSESTLRFSGRVGAGAGAVQTLTITNQDTADYALGAISAPAHFVKGPDTCSAATLAPGASCTVAISFAPTTPGPKSWSVTPAGHGPAPATAIGEALQPATAIAPAVHRFTGEPQTFTLTSTGAGPVAVGAVSLSGPDAAAFAIADDGCSQRTIAGSCSVTVALSPLAAGYSRAALSIATDAGAPVIARLEARAHAAGSDTPADASLPLPLARLRGDGGDFAGGSLASGPCDVDGDGYDDVVSGASQWSRIPATNSWEGAAYVTFGGPDFGGEDLAGLRRSIRLEGSSAGAFAGAGVGCADVNGDGIDDVLVGAWAYDDGRAARGRAYVVFGAKDLREQATLDLGALGARGFTIVGADAPEYDHLGYAVAGVGDLDGDGREEVAVMANTGDSTDLGRTNNGIVWIVPGQSGGARVDLSKPGTALARFDGASPGQMSAVAGVGDLDGDGVDDVAIGSYTATSAAGAAYAVSGATRGRVDLGDRASSLFTATGAFASHRLGIAIAAAGDVDGDGLADLAIGADSTLSANSDAAYVVYGSRTRAPGTSLDTAKLGADGYRIRGAAGSSTGFGVAGIGDANGDGFDDLAIGGYGAGANGAGWIVWGVANPTTLAVDGGLVPANPADTTRTLALDALGARGVKLDGQTAGERFGRAVAAVGDPDGNGATDVAFGSDSAFRHGRTNAGEVAVALLPGPPVAAPEQQPPAGAAPPPAPAPVAAPAPPRNTAVPRLASRRLKVDTRGRVAFAVRCPGCRGRLVLRYAGRTLGTVRLDGTATVRVKLPARLRTRAAMHATATLRVTLDGHTGTVTRTLKVTMKGRTK